MNKTLKRTICIATALFLSSFMSANESEDNKKYASYSKGDVYIDTHVPEYFSPNPYDVFVLDRRSGNNPDMRIYNSYKITSLEEQEEIIDILLRYEEEFESDWDRSKESLQREWAIHNLLYELGIKPKNTKHVDFDNEDEEDYKTYSLKRGSVRQTK